jgi:hypothetical protein
MVYTVFDVDGYNLRASVLFEGGNPSIKNLVLTGLRQTKWILTLPENEISEPVNGLDARLTHHQ